MRVLLSSNGLNTRHDTACLVSRGVGVTPLHNLLVFETAGRAGHDLLCFLKVPEEPRDAVPGSIRETATEGIRAVLTPNLNNSKLMCCFANLE
jgi:hypothetical protein